MDHRPKKTSNGVRVNGLSSVLIKTTAVTSLKSRLYSVARTVVLTMVGMEASVTLAWREKPCKPNKRREH